MPNPIPINQQAQSWSDLSYRAWDFDTVPGHVILPKKDFTALARYDSTLPTGVFPGKIWVCDWRDGTDHLCWWDTHPTMPNTCVLKHLPIMLLEAVQLIGGIANAGVQR